MKKVLIITYYWPPAGGPGVQRWLKFVKYLPDFNINPIVYCPKNPSYPVLDQSLKVDIDDNLTVLKTNIWEPHRWLKLGFKNKSSRFSKGLIPNKSNQSLLDRFLLSIRGNYFVPDSRKFWIKPSVKYLSNYLLKHQIDTIITTGPPHSLHLIGMKLRTKHNLKWIADFRDPWTAIGYHSALNLSKHTSALHKNLEHQVLNAADHIISTSNATKHLFESQTTRPVTTITNGFDTQKPKNHTLDKRFTLTHIGALHPDRNPTLLWVALSQILNENLEFKADFELVLVGEISPEVRQSLREHGLESALKCVGTVAHSEAVRFQFQTQVLLLIEANTEAASYIIPGKLFEYLNANRPIMAIGPETSDISGILEHTQTGAYFDYTNVTALKTHILSLYKAYKSSHLIVTPRNIEKYSRYHCTQQLSQVLNSL